MMIDAKRAGVLVESGVAAACAWCERLWESYDRTGVPACREDCGGPFVRRGFPRYKGPWGSDTVRFCFKCGRVATSMAEMNPRSGEIARVGICDDHVELFKEIVGTHKGAIIKEERMNIFDAFDRVGKT